MCGIVGGNLFRTGNQVEEAINLIQHRGRDAQGFVQFEDVFLGHNRLAIQDLDLSANQPMDNESGDVSIVYNGELWDGHQHVRDFLSERHSFKTQCSDTEVLLHLYEDYGPAFVEKLDGMFSFVLLDRKRRHLVFGRDWVGKLPFYYMVRNGQIAFASEMRVLTRMFGAQPKEIREVPPGTYSIYDMKWKSFQTIPFYRLPNHDLKIPPTKMVQHIRKSLTQGVSQRLLSDVPVCTLLSGGIDSLIITYLLKKVIPDIEAFVFSVGDNPKKKDDLHYARKAAELLGVPLHEVIVSREDVLEYMDQAVWTVEDPRITMVATAIPMLFLGKAIADKGFKVAFNGEGSDELWVSYKHMQVWKPTPEKHRYARRHLLETLHRTNLARTNKSLMMGGTVEARMPFLHRPLAEFSMGIPYEMRNIELVPWGRLMKPLLRQAFYGEFPEELLYRKKVTLQHGSHVERIVTKFGQPRLNEVYRKMFMPSSRQESIQELLS